MTATSPPQGQPAPADMRYLLPTPAWARRRAGESRSAHATRMRQGSPPAAPAPPARDTTEQPTPEPTKPTTLAELYTDEEWAAHAERLGALMERQQTNRWAAEVLARHARGEL